MPRFFGHFNTYLYHLISTPEALRYATRQVLEDFAADGVVYLELRTTPRALPPKLDAEGTIDLILSVIEEWNSDTSPETSMLVNLILSIDRAKHSSDQADRIVDLALKSKLAGRPVVGVDLAGDPTALTDLVSFRPAFKKAKDSGLGLTVHFAELPSDTLLEEMREMLSWNPDRLGHVVHVPLDVREEIVKRGIGVELCLTCNVLAGMLPPKSDPSNITSQNHESQSRITDEIPVSGFPDHHFGWWWTTTLGTNHPISLGTDDVGVFLSNSSDEHILAATHFQLDKDDLRELSRRAALGAFDKRALGIVHDRLANMH